METDKNKNLQISDEKRNEEVAEKMREIWKETGVPVTNEHGNRLSVDPIRPKRA